MKLYSALALLCLAAPAMADVLFTTKMHTDAVQTPQGEQAAKDETKMVWLAKDKVRVESPVMTCIVRLDQKKMYLLNTADRTYSTLALPLSLESYVPKEQAQAFEMIKTRFNVSAVVTPTGETERVHDWATKKFKVQIMSAGTTSDETIWTTKEIEADWATYWDAQSALRSMQPGTEGMIQEMKKLEGVTVKADRTRTTPLGKIHSVEELVSAERKEAPQGSYDIPSGFTEKPFDAMSELRKLGGARPAGGPGDVAPKRGEGKDGEKPAGDGTKRKKDQAGGDDKDKGGDGSKRREKAGGDDKGGG